MPSFNRFPVELPNEFLEIDEPAIQKMESSILTLLNNTKDLAVYH